MSVMNASAPGSPGAAAREPRVRELAREALALMAFSAAVSISVALMVVLGSGLGR